MRICLVIVIGLAVLAPSADAAPCSEPAGLRASLQRESRHARRWNLAWRITYTTLAVGHLAIAPSGTAERDQTRAHWVGGVKSALGALPQWTMPLRIRVPPPSGDVCDDRASLRNAAERAGYDEAATFWTSHVGGLVINITGAAILAHLTDWRTGALSFATGYAVGLIATYTMPRASWGRIREPAWTAAVLADGERYGLIVGRAF